MPSQKLGLPFVPLQTSSDYHEWPLLPDLFPKSFPGIKTSRDDVVVDIDRDRLEQRMRQYFDPAISHEQMKQMIPGAMESGARFDAVAVREHLIKRGFLPQYIVRYCYRPFDVRWLYWEPDTKLLDEKRGDYRQHTFSGNLWIEARQRQTMGEFDRGYVVSVAADNFGNGLSSFFPLYLRPKDDAHLFSGETPSQEPTLNLSQLALDYLASLGATDGEDLFYHALAVLHAPVYREENAGALRQDWPRIPLPATADVLRASAGLGRQVAALLDAETPVKGVTSGDIRPELSCIAKLRKVGGGSLDENAGDLRVTAGWGSRGQGGVTMPGKGRIVERPYSAAEVESLGSLARASLGTVTKDVYWNSVGYWENIPSRVWEYTIGGYQVLKKWLSYREASILGRSLTRAELREVQGTARRLAALRLLEPELDANYRAVTGEG